MKTWNNHDFRTPVQRGFTLIELLVVISIIGILAGLVVGLAPVAGARMKETRVRTELQQLVTAIEAYRARFGVYPPDGLVVDAAGNPARDAAGDFIVNPAVNPLFYELSGVFVVDPLSPNGFFQTRQDDERILPAAVKQYFGRDGFINATITNNPDRRRLFQTNFRTDQYAEIFRSRTQAGYTDLEVLTVGFSWDASAKRGAGFAWPPNANPQPVPTNPSLNPWRYVSTNPTNNPGSFDLWAEIPGRGDRIRIIGNWKQSN
jgi:prepilin-type N-terminal cleavage/methylation domain-containing protein